MLKGLTKIIVPLFAIYSLNCSTKVDVDTILDYVKVPKKSTPTQSVLETTQKELTFSHNNDTVYIAGSGFFGDVISRAVTISDTLGAKEGDTMAIQTKEGHIEYYNLVKHITKRGDTCIVPFDMFEKYPTLSRYHNGAKVYLLNGKKPSLNGRPEA